MKTRWTLFLLIYTLFYGYLNFIFMRAGIRTSQIFDMVTEILIFCLFLTLSGLLLKKTIPTTLKYLLLPTFGITWVVYIIRLFFDVFAGTVWIDVQHLKLDPTAPIELFRFGDFLVHFLPLLVLYQIIHRHQDELKTLIAQHARTMLMLLGLFPFFTIIVYMQFYDPYIIYSIPKNPFTQLVLYGLVPIICLYTTALFRHMTVPKTRTHTRTILNSGAALLILSGLGLGVALFGVSNLYESILSWMGLLALLIVALNTFSPDKNTWNARFLFPVFGFVLIVYILRELAFSLNPNSHATYLTLLDVTWANKEAWYSVYILLSYIIYAPLIARFLVTNLARGSAFRQELQRQWQASPTHRISLTLWNGFGGALLLGVFLLFNGADNRYASATSTPQMAFGALGVVILISLIFPFALYRKALKK